jgi:hypothetical protein
LSSERTWRALAAGLLLAGASLAVAQSGGSYAIPRTVVASGGGASSGGGFELRGTAGQPEPNATAATGGSFEVRGGFWRPGPIAPPADELFEDGFEP